MDAYSLDSDVYEALQILTSKPQFHSLTVHDMAPLVRHGTRRHFPARTPILEHGRHSESLHLVLQGRVKIERTYGLKSPIHIADIGPGDFVGEMGSFSGVARSATATALDPVETLELSEAQLERAMRHDNPFLVALIQLMQHRYRRA